MRLPSILNSTAICVNIILSAAVLWIVLGLRGPSERDDPARALAPDLRVKGMEAWFEKGPFVLLVGRDFPQSGSFAVAERGKPLMIRVENTRDAAGSPAKSVGVSLTADFYVSLDYLPSGAAQRLTFCHFKTGVTETLTDLNADGVWDTRLTRDVLTGVSRLYVWYRAAWREVVGGDRDPKQDEFHRRLMTGEPVFFSSEHGQWLLGAREPGREQ